MRIGSGCSRRPLNAGSPVSGMVGFVDLDRE
jgi:hypothetical protein